CQRPSSGHACTLPARDNIGPLQATAWRRLTFPDFHSLKPRCCGKRCTSLSHDAFVTRRRDDPTMRRRAFIGTLVGAFLDAPLTSEAQPAGRVPRIGYVSPSGPSFGAYPSQRAFLEGLRDHGYVQGHDFILEVRSTEGRSERLFDATTELVRAPVDVLLIGVCGAPLDAARRATQTIPIVVAACNDDLVETGIVASLGRPGGNITGLSKLTPELAAKRL